MNNFFRSALMSAGVAGAVIAAGGAQAATYSFSDGTVAAGTINTTTGIVTLTDLVVNPVGAASLISGLIIDFSTPLGTVSLTSSSGQLLDISSNTGSFVGGTIDHWGVATSGSQLALAAAGTGSPGGTPHDLIIGPGTGTSQLGYSNANASITNNHQPSIWETGTFALSGISGLIVSSVEFEYGTGPDSNSGLLTPHSPTGGNESTTPLPGALPLFASGFAVLGLFSKRRKRKAAA
jgi:hypothetical protein